MKRFLALMIVCFATVFMFSPSAIASDIRNSSDFLSYLQRSGSRIFDQISEAQNKAQNLIDIYNIEVKKLQNSSNTNDKIEKDIVKLTEKLNSDIDNVVNNLITATNAEAQGVVLMSAKDGAEVTNEYISIEIGGRILLVDPQKVMGI